MTHVSMQPTAFTVPVLTAPQVQSITQRPEVGASSAPVGIAQLTLTPPSVPDDLAQAITDATQGIFDSAHDIDVILEESQALRQHHHDPLVQQGTQAVREQIDDFVRSGQTPTAGSFSAESPVAELSDALCVELGDNDQWHDTADTNECAATERLCKVYEALLAIAENKSDAPGARSLSNVANQIVHSLITTGMPTTARLGAAYGIEFALQSANASAAARTALGAMAGVLPLLAGAAGLVHDNTRGTATLGTNISRGSALLLGGAILCAGGMTGALATVAPTLLAYNLVQRGLSDSIQSWIQLKNNTVSPANCKAAAITLATTIVQGLCAYTAYYYAAPNSGQGVATEGEGWQPLNDLIRGAIITATSTGGAFLTHLLRSSVSSPEKREDLRLSLAAAMPGQGDIVNQLSGKYFFAGTATTSYFLIDDMLSPFIEAMGVSPAQHAALSNALAAIIDGGQFIFEESATPPVKPVSHPANVDAGLPV